MEIKSREEGRPVIESQKEYEEIQRWYHLAEQLKELNPQPRKEVDLSLLCACGKINLPLDQLKTLKTVGCPNGAVDRICNPCMDDIKGFCPIVCVQCREVIARIKPGKKKNGFTVLPGKAYHVQECPECGPESKYKGKAVVVKTIEELIFLRKTGQTT